MILFWFVFVVLLPALSLCHGNSDIKLLCEQVMFDSSQCGSQSEAYLYASMFTGWNQGKLKFSSEQINKLHQMLPSFQEDLPEFGLDATEIGLLLNSALPASRRGFQTSVPVVERHNWLEEINLLLLNHDSSNQLFSLAKFEKTLDSKIRINAQIGTSHAKTLNGNSQSELVAKELLVYKPLEKRFLNGLALGRQHFTEGMGLSLSGIRDGILIHGNLEDKPLELGWFDGLHARITSPFLFGIPFSFYTRHKENRLRGREYHSGLNFSHQIKRLGVSGQLAEYTDKSLGRGTASTLQAYELSLSLTKNLKSYLGHTKTGLDYRSGFRDAGIHYTLVLPDTRQMSAQRVISWERNALIGELAGFQEFMYALEWKPNSKSTLEASVHQLLDNTNNLQRVREEFRLARLEWKHQLRTDFLLSSSAYWIDYQNHNQISNYLLSGKSMQDNFWLSTELKLRF